MMSWIFAVCSVILWYYVTFNAITAAVNHQLFTVEAWIPFKGSPYGIGGGEKWH
jgi:hypothetical protein